MIDYSAIENEIKDAIKDITAFKSIETGHIRENIANSAMPALDISCEGHSYNFHDTDAQYKIPTYIWLRVYGTDRKENADAFKVLMEQVCAKLEVLTGSSFDVVRNIEVAMNEMAASGGSGSVVRTGLIQMQAWA